MPLLKYITSVAVPNTTVTSIVDSTNWAIDNAIIKAIKVETTSTDWSFWVGCDDLFGLGMYSNVKIAQNVSGTQILFVDLPYINNDAPSKEVHVFFYNYDTSDGCSIDIYGEEAQI